jgi:hypothetical protein
VRPRPEHLAAAKPLFAVRRKSDGEDIAYVEAKDKAQAARRAAQLIGHMELLGSEEVEVVWIELRQGPAPTFFDSFFPHSFTAAGLN